MVCRTSV